MSSGVILAGGIGKRMGRTSEPKQYMMLGSKPIIIHTIDQFLINKDIKNIIVLVPADWINYTKELIDKYAVKVDKQIVVIAGGSERSETLYIGCLKAKELSGDNVKIISHDAVRPFISQRIISENINALSTNKVSNTVVSSPDTIVKTSKDENFILEIPERKYMQLGQTPQSFYNDDYIKLYETMSEEDLMKVTDACKMFVENGFEVKIVQGSQENIKITTLLDYKIANFLLSEDVRNDK